MLILQAVTDGLIILEISISSKLGTRKSLLFSVMSSRHKTKGCSVCSELATEDLHCIGLTISISCLGEPGFTAAPRL